MTDMELQELVRREFPFLEDITYFNVCSVSLPPVSVQRAYSEFVEDCVKAHGVKARAKAYEMINANRAQIARLINCDSDEVAYAPNTSQGIAVLQESLDWHEGDNVVITDLENFANLYQWKNLERKGVGLKVVKSHDGGFTPEDIAAVIDERTRVVSISSVAFETGFHADVAAIGRLCREKGIIYSVDIMQSVGRMKVDVKAMNIDYAATGSHKALLCSYGNGFIFCSHELQKKLTPATASKESLASEPTPAQLLETEGLPWYGDARKFEAGNFNFAGIYAMSKALNILLAVGPEETEARIRALEAELREKAAGLKNLRIGLSDWPEARRSGMVIVYYPQGKTDLVREVLDRHNMFVTIMPSYIRIGIDFFNTSENVDTAVKVLREIDAGC